MKEEKDKKDWEDFDWVEWDDSKFAKEDGIAFLCMLGIFVFIQVSLGLFFWLTS